ncbi:hypothetical protein [Kitasatospora sp. NPDC088346]|uniref:hypothetical protein n=1 Tax=Kitasatospora sp. NPDC088346 TaxID=3364073 RepID=UPI00380FE019
MIVFPDAEALALAHLRAALPNLRSGTELPAVADGHLFLVVGRTGGSMTWPVLDTAALDLEVWGPDRADAHDALQAVLGALLALDSQPGPIASVRVTSAPQYAPDAITGEPRWLASIDLATRATRSE